MTGMDFSWNIEFNRYNAFVDMARTRQIHVFIIKTKENVNKVGHAHRQKLQSIVHLKIRVWHGITT